MLFNQVLQRFNFTEEELKYAITNGLVYFCEIDNDIIIPYSSVIEYLRWRNGGDIHE